MPGGDWHRRKSTLLQRTALEDAEELLVTTRHRAKAKAKDAVARGVAEAAAKAHNLAYTVNSPMSR